jgi:hypothetical protein
VIDEDREIAFSFILDGKVGQVHVMNDDQLTVLGGQIIGMRMLAEIDEERIGYWVPQTQKISMEFSVQQTLHRKWSYMSEMPKLLAKDAIHVLRKRENSLFPMVPNQPRKNFLVTQNEVLNALKSERHIATVDQAELLELFLQAFEENQHVNLDMLYLSTNFIQEEIQKKVNYFEKRKFITPSASGYTIDEQQANVIEKRIERSRSLPSEGTPALPHRYFQPTKVRINKPIAFIGMPFKGSDEKYQVIDDVCRTNGYLAFRIDRDPNFENFLNKVAGYVLASRFCIFDITDSNPNVMLELGVALTTEKSIIAIADEDAYEKEIQIYQQGLSEKLSDPELRKLEDYFKSAKIVRLVPADIRERHVHLYRSLDELKSILDVAIQQIM